MSHFHHLAGMAPLRFTPYSDPLREACPGFVAIGAAFGPDFNPAG